MIGGLLSCQQAFCMGLFVCLFPDFSMTLRPGEPTGIMGPSGCGKSSLSLLLCRMYRPCRGDILLDGYDINRLEPYALRRMVSTTLGTAAWRSAVHLL